MWNGGGGNWNPGFPGNIPNLMGNMFNQFQGNLNNFQQTQQVGNINFRKILILIFNNYIAKTYLFLK